VDRGVYQTDDFGQEGGSKNSVFGRTSLIDDPIEADHAESHYNYNNHGSQSWCKSLNDTYQELHLLLKYH